MSRVNAISYERFGVDELLLFDGNPRRGDVARISESLRARGQYKPIVVNRGTETGRPLEVLAGNHTLMAARSIGWEEIDCAVIDIDDDTAKAIVASDNRLADLGGYDDEALAALLSDLESLDGTGYTDSDLNEILKAQEQPEELTDRDEAPSVPEKAPISVPGDVWELGPHRVWCGDSTNIEGVLENLLFDGLADCVWTDPPYGVSYSSNARHAGDGYQTNRANHSIMNDGEEGLAELLHGAFTTLVAAAKPGAPVYVAHADAKRLVFETAFREAGLLFRQNLIWVKNNHAIGRADYHYKHEPILFGQAPKFGDEAQPPAEDDPDTGEVDTTAPYKEGHGPVLYGFAPGGAGRLGRGGPRWFGNNAQFTTLEFAMPRSNDVHPTMKPVDLVLRMLNNSCPPGGIVLDLFGGSGSTLIAAHHRGAQARLVELDPRYVDVICRRWQEHTGSIPRRDGEEVDFLA